MSDTQSRRRALLVTALRRAAPVLAAAALLAAATAGPADAAGTVARAGPLSPVAAGPGPAAGFQPASASFQSPASGFVLGAVGCRPGQACAARLIATADSGAHWRFLATPDVRLRDPARGPRASNVSSVVFASRRDGWLYGPALWWTRDGGTHWRKISLGGTIEQMAASAGRVYAVVAPGGGKPPELFASPAGRDAWARVGRFTGSTLAVYGRAAWFGGSSTYLWATADGVHWQRYPFRCPGARAGGYGLASIAAASPSHVVFLCASGYPAAGQQGKEVLNSGNGGRAVHLAGPAPLGGVGGMIAVPPRRPKVITLATEYFLDRSAHGGKTWTTRYYPTGGAPWNSLSYVSGTAGWAEFGVPPGSGLLRTTDAGITWHQVSFPASAARPVTAYVVNGSSGTVTPIRNATKTAGKAIKVGSLPDAIAITPDGKTVYVANGGDAMRTSDTVTPIDTATNKVGKAINVGTGPDAIAITPNGKTAYVGSLFAETVTPIRTVTNTPGKAINAGSTGAIAITPNGKTAYVVNYASDTVTPIDTAADKAGKAINVGIDPTAIAITPNGKTAYVANTVSDTVTPIDTATSTAGKAITVGSGPVVIAITPNGKTAYVANYAGTVTPIDTATNTAGKAIKVGSGPRAIAITPNGKTAYVTNYGSGTVTPIRISTNTVGKAIPVGRHPWAIAITPDGKTAYVTNGGSGTVTPIRIPANKAGKAIKVGNGPSEIAITP